MDNEDYQLRQAEKDKAAEKEIERRKAQQEQERAEEVRQRAREQQPKN
jgi:hypothetical protein